MQLHRNFLAFGVVFLLVCGMYTGHAQDTTISFAESFMQNNGQLKYDDGSPASEVEYYTDKSGVGWNFMNDRVGIVFTGAVIGDNQIEVCREDMLFVNANPVTVQSAGESLDYHNFYLGNDANGVLNVRQYDELSYANLYNGIDAVFYGNRPGLEFEFRLDPLANIEDLVLRFEGTTIVLDQDGNAVITFLLGTLVLLKPEAEVEVNGVKHDVEADFNVSNDEVRIDVDPGPHTPNDGVTLRTGTSTNPSDYSYLECPNPVVTYTWSTYYGGSRFDRAADTQVDNNGNIIVSGHTQGVHDFPLTARVIQIKQDNINAFVLKFGPNRNRKWAVMIGAQEDEWYPNCVVNSSGSIFVVAQKDREAIGTFEGPFKNPGGGAHFINNVTCSSGHCDQIYLFELNSGGVLQWATLHGGEVWFVSDIAIDGNDNIYLLGRRSTIDPFPFLDPGGSAYFEDKGSIFLSQFSPSRQQVWTTSYPDYAGSSALHDEGLKPEKLHIDNLDRVFVLCYTEDNSLATHNRGGGAYYQSTFGGDRDLFILEFSNQRQLRWATYFGGSSTDMPLNISSDASGNLYIVGHTISTNFPTYDPGGNAYYSTSVPNSKKQMFISKLNYVGALTWSTLYGGGNDDEATGVAAVTVPGTGSAIVYVVGNSWSSNFPLKNRAGYYNQSTFGNFDDATILQFKQDGELKWATFFGGDGSEQPLEVRAMSPTNFYFVGDLSETSHSRKYPLRAQGAAFCDFTDNGGTEVLITEFEYCDTSPAVKQGTEEPVIRPMQTASFKAGLFPNPTENGIVHLDIEMNDKTTSAVGATLVVTDQLGRSVVSDYLPEFTTSYRHSIDLRHVTAGVYLVKLRLEGSILTQQLIVR